MQLASLALSKIIDAFPEDADLDAIPAENRFEEGVDEIDASELERTSSRQADTESKKVAQDVKKGEKGKKGGCLIS